MALKAGIAGRQRKLDDAALAGRGRLVLKGNEDCIGGIAGLVDDLAGLKRAAGARLLCNAPQKCRVDAAKKTDASQRAGDVVGGRGFRPAAHV
jgi:hypothetical protein